MKKSGKFWLPDSDAYFYKFLSEGQDGFQLERLERALSYVNTFDDAIDGGAHVGTWTIHMSKFFKRVHAFEPASDAFECLDKNIRSHRISNITLYNMGLMDEEGSGSIVEDQKYRQQGNTGARYLSKNGSDICFIPIDILSLPKLGFMKLDLEGAELLALKGAFHTLKLFKPVVMIELKKGFSERFGYSMEEPLQYLESLGAKVVETIGADHILTF